MTKRSQDIINQRLTNTEESPIRMFGGQKQPKQNMVKYQHQMRLLREEKVKERRAAIKKIQEKKDAAIDELTHKHEQKYE